METEPMAHVLIIDDDPMTCEVLADLVLSLGHAAEKALCLSEGLQKLSLLRPDLVLLDVNLPDGDGLAAINEIRYSPSAPEIIIITGEGSADGAELAIRNGAWDYLRKPLSVETVQLSLNRVLQYRWEKRTKTTARALRREQIVGKSPALFRCLDTVAKAADTDAAVLITGETGSGKELFARAIHDNSPRADRNFVIVDCANLPPTLVESVLFGHEKGAFTGAIQDHEGLIGQAHEGTLFLDEVGEMPLELQKSFLRVLQEQRFRPIGSSREKVSNFRLVAATNRNLEELVARCSFRQDLFFRLRGVVCALPPLRERREDIAELALARLAALCQHSRKPMKGFCPGFLETLLAYNWPGNVRELFNAIETAFIQAGDDPVLYDIHLPAEIRAQVKAKALEAAAPAEPGMENEAATPTAAAAPAELLFAGRPLPRLQQAREEMTSRLERQYLLELLHRTNNDLNRACAISGLSLSQFYRLLRKHRLKP